MFPVKKKNKTFPAASGKYAKLRKGGLVGDFEGWRGVDTCYDSVTKGEFEQ